MLEAFGAQPEKRKADGVADAINRLLQNLVLKCAKADGERNDGDPLPPAQELQGLKSRDGPVLLFNAHVSDRQNKPIEFPGDEGGLPDKFARLLFRMSSPLPPKLTAAAKADGFAVGPG